MPKQTLLYQHTLLSNSKTCFVCGHKHELTLKDRIWHCPDCGTDHARDLNAAKNILREGTSSQGVEILSPALAG